jgi:predicted negative regulator of RcsB-dependent stress response
MSNQPRREDERTLQQRFIEFLSSYRVVLLTVLIVIVVGIVGSFLYLEITERRAVAAANLAEELRSSYQEWTNLEEGDEKSAQLEEIESTAAEILDRFGNTFAAQRAYFVLASVAWENENYQEAASQFSTLGQEFSRSYLAPVALFNAAVAQEQLGNAEEARSLYRRIVEEYAETSAQVPRSLFALGRLSESSESWEEAATYYNRILDEYGQSSWTTLARNRIIFLQTEELISESS